MPSPKAAREQYAGFCMDCQKRDAENTGLRGMVESLRATSGSLRRRLAEAMRERDEARHERDEARHQLKECRVALSVAHASIEKLRERARQNSNNSSVPSSQDPLQAPKPKRTREPSTRAKGGQPGHRGHGRLPVDENQVRERVDHWPERCEHCEHHFESHERVSAGEPRCWPWIELDERTEVAFAILGLYHWLRCPECEGLTRARAGKEACQSAFGPILQARIVTLSWRFSLSYRDVVEHLREFERVRIGQGTVQKIHKRAAAAAAPVLAEIDAHIEAAPVVHADETPMPVQDSKLRVRQQLWAVCTKFAARFRIDPSRSTEAALRLLGACQEGFILVTDRLGSYDKVVAFIHRQLCWAHLRRNFQAVAERPGVDGELGAELVKLTNEGIFHNWHQFLADADREALAQRMISVREALRALLETGKRDGENPKTRGICRHLLPRFEALFTYVRHPGVEPTNNRAEGCLRRWVIWRRRTAGVRTDASARIAETLMSVVSTCQMQRRSAYRTFIGLFQAQAQGTKAPSIFEPQDHRPEQTSSGSDP